MIQRDYYSVRTGKLKLDSKTDLKVLIRLFLVIYNNLEDKGYFQKYFGYYCVDQDKVIGELGKDLESIFFIHLRKENLFPIREKSVNYSEEDLFDVVEFLHDHCSRGVDGDYHSYNNCGYHYSTFNDKEGKQYFRNQMNPVFKHYTSGFEISEDGEILQLGDLGLEHLLEASIPDQDDQNITSRISKAILKFRRHKSTLDDRQDAIRELVDVLEYLRPQAKILLNKDDESDLFNIANNFGIRHHNQQQKNNYDKPIWHSWMFYHYLATIHALIRIIEKNK